MKFIIDKYSFLNSIQLVQSITDKKTSIPILSNVLLECQDDILNIFATDLEISVKQTLSAKILNPGKTTIISKKLFEIVKSIPSDTISVTMDSDDRIEIVSENVVFQLKTISFEEYPSFPAYDSSTFIEVEPSVFLDLINKTFYSTSNEDIKFNLSGIFLEPSSSSNAIRFVATDGHRLSLAEKGLAVSNMLQDGIIIPKKGITEIRKILALSESNFSFQISKSQLIVLHDNITMFIRLIDGLFPKYREVIPESNARRTSLNRERFLEALKRVSIVNTDRYKGIQFNFSTDMLTLSSSNPDIGFSEEKIPIQYPDGDVLDIGFNARYFIDVLNCLESEEIFLEFSDESSPAIIKTNDDESFLALVMPMRI